MKKALLIFAVALVAAAACCGFAACGETHKEITGTWAVVYRFTDENGGAVNEHVNGEYVVFTEKTFTYYKQEGSEYVARLETPVTYHYGTGQSNKFTQGSTEHSLYTLNRFSSYYITLDEYGKDTDFGLKFCGTKFMTFGKYASSAVYALLIRCDNLGDIPSETDLNSISGNWVLKEGSYTREFDVNAEQYEDYTKETVSGFFTMISPWRTSNATVNGIKYDYSRYVYTFVYAEKDYIIQVVTEEYKTESGAGATVTFDSSRMYFKNNA